MIEQDLRFSGLCLTRLHESDVEDLLHLRVVRRHVEDDLLTLLPPLLLQLRLPVSTALWSQLYKNRSSRKIDSQRLLQ